jgi:hypothetical protein
MKQPFLAGVTLTVILGLAQLPARGDVITTLHSTGAGLGTGVNDPNWTVSSSAPGAVITNGSGGAGITIPGISPGFLYVTPPAGTQWDGPTASNTTNQPGSGPGEQPSLFTWTTTFQITAGQIASTANIIAAVTADNQITTVLLNGHTVATNLGDPTFSFQTLNNLVLNGSSGPAAGDFVQGTNTLQFIVNNAAAPVGQLNPTAFIASLSGTVTAGTAIPEPSMVILGGLGGILVVGYRRIREFCVKA